MNIKLSPKSVSYRLQEASELIPLYFEHGYNATSNFLLDNVHDPSVAALIATSHIERKGYAIATRVSYDHKDDVVHVTMKGYHFGTDIILPTNDVTLTIPLSDREGLELAYALCVAAESNAHNYGPTIVHGRQRIEFDGSTTRMTKKTLESRLG